MVIIFNLSSVVIVILQIVERLTAANFFSALLDEDIGDEMLLLTCF